jgi:hypothetical protein
MKDLKSKSKGKLVAVSPVDPKQACAQKKMTFDAISATLQLIVSAAAQSGADKYGTWNWLDLKDGTMSVMTYVNAVQRHLTLFKAGQDYTSDTGIHNLDSIICGLSVVRDAMIFGKVKDDRTKMTPEQIEILEKIINKEIPLTVEVKK